MLKLADMNIMRIFLMVSILGIIISGCKKEPGEGGRAKIRGKVYCKNYNSEFTVLINEYYAPGENVYIIYGDNTTVGDNVKTSSDGSFEFPYLRKGKYKIFAVSKDTTSPGLTGEVSVIKEIEIKSKKETVIVPDLVIIK